MSPKRPRLWETLRMDAGSLGVERSDVPRVIDAGDIAVFADASGFTVTNSSRTDASILVALMAKATHAEEAGARERLGMLTSCEGQASPLRVPLEGDAHAYARLWQDDVEVQEHARGGWTATRSGIVVLPVPAGSSFALAHDPGALRLGVVVAAVAAAGVGLVDVPLVSIERGATASIGERPDPNA